MDRFKLVPNGRNRYSRNLKKNTFKRKYLANKQQQNQRPSTLIDVPWISVIMPTVSKNYLIMCYICLMPYWWLIILFNTRKSPTSQTMTIFSEVAQTREKGHICVSQNVFERYMYEWTHFGCAHSDVNNNVEAPEHNPNSIDQDESRVVY